MSTSLKLAPLRPDKVERAVISGCGGFNEVKLEDAGFKMTINAWKNADGMAQLIYYDKKKLYDYPLVELV